MPKEITEGRLTFRFASDKATKYDDWVFYRSQFNGAFGGSKAVDIIEFGGERAWLIEVKDYCAQRRSKAIDIGDEVAFKVRDTLAGLVAAHCNANEQDERRMASQILRKRRMGVVLHLEQPTKPSRLFPQVIKPANALQKLKQKLRGVDAHPRVVDRSSLHPSMDWTVSG